MAKLISVTTALETIAQVAKPTASIPMPLKHAHGHVVAETLTAKTTLPPLDASAMDGYAMKIEAHHAQGSIFKQIGAAPAGTPFHGTVGTNECVRIFTGGAVPAGANHVIMQENAKAAGSTITLTEAISPASHIRKAGIDFKTGDTIIERGTCLDAYGVALLAAANHSTVSVYQRPRIALIANGDELVEPGQNLGVEQIISSNPYGLAPLIESWGAIPVFTNISKDDPDAIKSQIQSCADADILLPIGGASVGDHDYMRSVFNDLGYAPHFTKVAIKPGKPTWFGTLSNQYVLGLPGNPASALVCAHIFLKPLIHALTGNTLAGNVKPANTTITAILTQPMPANTWRTGYVRALANVGEDGRINVTPYPRQDSSLITPFLSANCLLECPVDTPALNVGDTVQILPIKPFNP